MAIQQFTADQFRTAARHFTQETTIEVSGVRILVSPSLVVPTDGSWPYYDIRFSVGNHLGRYVLLNSPRGWDPDPHSGNHWNDVRRHLGI